MGVEFKASGTLPLSGELAAGELAVLWAPKQTPWLELEGVASNASAPNLFFSPSLEEGEPSYAYEALQEMTNAYIQLNNTGDSFQVGGSAEVLVVPSTFVPVSPVLIKLKASGSHAFTSVGQNSAKLSLSVESPRFIANVSNNLTGKMKITPYVGVKQFSGNLNLAPDTIESISMGSIRAGVDARLEGTLHLNAGPLKSLSVFFEGNLEGASSGEMPMTNADIPGTLFARGHGPKVSGLIGAEFVFGLGGKKAPETSEDKLTKTLENLNENAKKILKQLPEDLEIKNRQDAKKLEKLIADYDAFYGALRDAFNETELALINSAVAGSPLADADGEIRAILDTLKVQLGRSDSPYRTALKTWNESQATKGKGGGDKGTPPPPLDTDGDGLLDSADSCPNAAEDVDGFQDEDGCPELDNDADGILDTQDRCPMQAEDVDAFADEDGCPDPDNDEDGILDFRDQCSSQAETVNGFDDTDGCPDVVTAPAKPAAPPASAGTAKPKAVPVVPTKPAPVKAPAAKPETEASPPALPVVDPKKAATNYLACKRVGGSWNGNKCE